MAAPDPSDKIKGKEYTNWLKVSLALYYMKSGLHTFIQSEVDCLHQSLAQTIYGSPTVPLPPCSMCDASHVIRNKYSGVWTFPRQCGSYCDVWLYELLKLHTNPKSQTIYWNNSDIPSWPFKSWECAKVFMPRGQTHSNVGPTECDSQALLMLLSSCTHFHNKLSPQGLNLLHAISTIWNKLMHDGEMKVPDADRMSFIQQIIQLLEDPVCLKSLRDCKTAVENIQEIENDSLNVFFNVDTEMKALKAAVNELRLERGTQEKVLDNIDSLKEECKNLREQLTERFVDAEKELQLHRVRMDTIQRDVQSVKEETDTALKQQEEKCQEMHAAVTQLSESMETISTCVAKHESRFVAVEENVQGFGRKLEELETNTLTQKEINSHRKRKATGDGISDCDTSEDPTRGKRPESDDLRQLKNQTEDDLDTFRQMGFILTSHTEKAKKLLQEKRSIVIKGNPGEGKTSTALHLIDNNNYTDQRVVIIRPKQWEKVDTDWVKIVVLEDIFGKYDLDPDRLKEWMNTYLGLIQNHVDEGKLQVIITIRDDIFSKAFSKLKSFKLFHSDRSLTLCSSELKLSDKNSILNRELKRNNKDMTVDKIEQCIACFDGVIGFPQCCSLFAFYEDLFVQGPDFFKSPEKFLVDNIRNLKKDSFLSLAFLFWTNEIEEKYLSPSQIKESKKYLPVLEDLAKYLHISYDESTVISLRESYDHYSGLYVKKVLSYKHHSRGEVSKSCIHFSHATVYEAVGQVLGEKCPEMVVKYGDSGYLYGRTYTAEAKDDDSRNVFIPTSVYGLLAERMVQDVVEKKNVESAVKHSALKQNQFLMKLKDELQESKKITDFLMARCVFFEDVKKGYCITFLQCLLQCDEDAVKLVYSQFMEFLACIHDNNVHDCWQCKEKQKLLEFALYYHHLEIADQLITVNARYTHVSLCNAARHDDLSRVPTILEDLKRRQVFNSECIEAKHTLYRAYLKGNQNVIEILLQEGITLHYGHVIDAVVDGDINVLMKVVEHLKLNKNWDPNLGEDMMWRHFYSLDWYSHPFRDFDSEKMPLSTALYITYCKERFDMADYLLKNEAKVTWGMFNTVSRLISPQAVARVIQNLKDTGTWDPHCYYASEALKSAYEETRHDVCDLLIQEGVSLTMKNLSSALNENKVSLDFLEKVIQHLKNTHSWDPKCNDASEALQTAYVKNKFDVCDLLIQEGVSLTMKDLSSITSKCGELMSFAITSIRVVLEPIKKAIQHLKDTDSWDPTCDEVSNAFIKAYETKRSVVCGLLIEEGVSCAIQYLPVVTSLSLELVKTVVKQLKDTNSWDAKCHDASKALEMAYSRNKHDVCHWLIQEGVSLTMRNIANVTREYRVSLESFKEIIQHLKDADCWDPKNVHASKAFENAYKAYSYNVCDVLIQEGVPLTMNTFLKVTKNELFVSTEHIKKIIQHLKDIDGWDPRCDVASEALEVAFVKCCFHAFDLLFQEGVSLKMKHLPFVIKRSQDLVKTAVKNLKDTNSWDAKCDDASKALAMAYGQNQYDVCDLLIQEGVSLTMKHLPGVINIDRDHFSHFHISIVSLESIKKAIQHLKDTNSWDAKCDDASEALAKAYGKNQYDVCDLLIQEGVSLTMKHLPGVIIIDRDDSSHFHISIVSLESVKKAVQHLKDTNSWDAMCDDASEALAKVCGKSKYDVYDLLIQEGVSLTMKNLPGVIPNIFSAYMDRSTFHPKFTNPFKSVRKAIQDIKNTGSWDPKCNDASRALENAYMVHMYDTCDLLIQDGVPLTMKCICSMPLKSIESVKTAVKQLKDNDRWDAKCDDASKALAKAYREEENDVCDLLIQEGVTLTMKNLACVLTSRESLESVQKAVQHLKDNDSWDPKCDHASKALEVAYNSDLYDVCHLLIQEGVSLTMSNLTSIFSTHRLELKTAKKVIQHLKDNDSWDPKCDHASKALEVADRYSYLYDVYDLLIQEGVFHH